MLGKDARGRWRIKSEDGKLGAFASKAQIEAFESGAGDLNVQVNVGSQGSRSRSRGGGGGVGQLLRLEAVQRLRAEGAADFLAGLYAGFAARSRAAMTPQSVAQRAADWWNNAHAVDSSLTPSGIRDARQWQLGYDLGMSDGPAMVALHMGITPAMWAAMAPAELVQSAQQQQQQAPPPSSKWLDGDADDVMDTIMSGVAGAALGDAAGGLVTAAATPFVGPVVAAGFGLAAQSLANGFASQAGRDLSNGIQQSVDLMLDKPSGANTSQTLMFQ